MPRLCKASSARMLHISLQSRRNQLFGGTIDVDYVAAAERTPLPLSRNKRLHVSRQRNSWQRINELKIDNPALLPAFALAHGGAFFD